MALSASTVWEVRPSAGNDTNGGGFVAGSTGTDYSQQNSKNSGTTDKSVTDGVGIGTTTFTSVTANFGTSIVGNIIFLSGTGITTGWYQVTARASATSITLDRSPGTGTGATVNIGGALATITQAFTNSTVSLMTIYAKASGTITTTAAIVLGNVAITIIGYTTTRGDNGRVTWTTSTNSINLIDCGNAYCVFQNINFTCTAGTPGDCFHAKSTSNAPYVHLKNCIINGFNIGCNGNEAIDWGILTLVIESTEIKSCVSHGVFCTGMVVCIGSTIHNNGGAGIENTNGGGIACHIFCIFSAIKANTSHGLYNASGLGSDFITVVNSDIVNNGGDGVRFNLNTGYGKILSWNGIYYGNTGFQMNALNGILIASRETNSFGANGTAQYNNIPAEPTDITLTADPFTSRTGTPPDLSLNSTTGGGAACKGAGTPATLPFT